MKLLTLLRRDFIKKIVDVSSVGFHERNGDENPVPIFFDKRASRCG